MSVYAFLKTGSTITINAYEAVVPTSFFMQRMAENELLVAGDNNAFNSILNTLTDTISVNGETFNGSAEQLKALLYSEIFISPQATSFKKYVALLNQAGTDAPVATVLNSNSGDYLGAIVWTRLAAGHYRGTLEGAFPTAKTWLMINQNNNNYAGVSYFNQLNNNQVFLICNDDAGAQVDDDLIDRPIEIRIYP